MFQSYNFKQHLTLSFAANYEPIMEKADHHDHEVCNISVQVMTSAEMTLLILKEKALLDNILKVLDKHVQRLAGDPRNKAYYVQCNIIVHDIKYLARPECLQYCIQNTDMVENLIRISEKIYFIEAKAPRSSMVMYMQDGEPNEELINLEVLLIKVLNMYLKELKYNDLEKNQSILQAFIETFMKLSERVKKEKKTDHGIYILPIHRCFSFYLTRLLFFNLLDKRQFADSFVGLNIQQIFRIIFKANLPKEFRDALERQNPGPGDVHGVDDDWDDDH